MVRFRELGKSLPFQKIFLLLCYLPLLVALFVPTTSFLQSLLPAEVWYKGCLIAAIVLAGLSGRLFRRDAWKELFEAQWFLWFVAFIGWLGILWVVYPDGKETGEFKYWLLPGALIFFLWVASPKSWKSIAICFLIVGLINSVAGFGIWIAHHFDPGYRSVVTADPLTVGTGEGWWYLVGGGVHPVAGLRNGAAINGMADILFWPFMIAVGYLAAPKHRWLAIAGILILTLGIFVTYSRPTAVVMILGVAFYFFLRSRKRISVSRQVVVVILVLAGLSVTLLLLMLPRAFVGTVFFRFGMWQQTLAFFQQFPSTLILGGGFPRIIDYPFGVWDTHNMYLFLAVSNGVPGLLIFLAMVGHILRSGWRIFSSGIQNPMAPHAAAALSALACFLIRGFVESQVNESDLRFAFVFFFVYTAATLREEFSPLPALPATVPA